MFSILTILKGIWVESFNLYLKSKYESAPINKPKTQIKGIGFFKINFETPMNSHPLKIHKGMSIVIIKARIKNNQSDKINKPIFLNIHK